MPASLGHNKYMRRRRFTFWESPVIQSHKRGWIYLSYPYFRLLIGGLQDARIHRISRNMCISLLNRGSICRSSNRKARGTEGRGRRKGRSKRRYGLYPTMYVPHACKHISYINIAIGYYSAHRSEFTCICLLDEWPFFACTRRETGRVGPNHIYKYIMKKAFSSTYIDLRRDFEWNECFDELLLYTIMNWFAETGA